MVQSTKIVFVYVILILTLVTNDEEKRIRNYYLIIDMMLKTFDKISKLIENSEAASKDKDLLYHLCSCESLGMPILTTWALRNHLGVTEDLFVRELEIDCKGTVQVIEKNVQTNITNKSREVFIQITCGEIKADSRGMFFLFRSVIFFLIELN
jgi:hypothetical protein